MSSGRVKTTLLNYGLFQAGWFICVLGAAAGWPQLAALVGFALVLMHLALVGNPLREGMLLVLSLALGLLVDAVHIQTGILLFPVGSLHPGLPPPWILVLWLQFAMTLHYSLAWLNGRYLIGALLGALSGPLAYWAGVRLGAAGFGDDLIRCLLQIGVLWAVVLVLLLWAAAKTAPPAVVGCYRLFAESPTVCLPSDE
ncbi:MAG: DUF2878 domain-containing protein [Desulfobulbaceae bacterium]|nr:DUF2878 domain-containing protein [Desulfobulbaceae bacterium]